MKASLFEVTIILCDAATRISADARFIMIAIVDMDASQLRPGVRTCCFLLFHNIPTSYGAPSMTCYLWYRKGRLAEILGEEYGVAHCTVEERGRLCRPVRRHSFDLVSRSLRRIKLIYRLRVSSFIHRTVLLMLVRRRRPRLLLELWKQFSILLLSFRAILYTFGRFGWSPEIMITSGCTNKSSELPSTQLTRQC
jgi:hypothetical protein